DLLLRQAVDERRIKPAEFGISLLGLEAEDAYEPRLVRGEGVLSKNAEEAFEAGDPLVEVFDVGLGDLEDLAVFEGVDVEDGGTLVDHTTQIAHPPAGRGKLNDVLVAVSVDGVAAEDAAGDEGGSLHDIAFAGEELFLFYRLVAQGRREMGLLLRGERDMA